MKTSSLILAVLATAAFGAYAADATLPNKSCSITCYEKTPACYVTKDSSGCLVITNTKPKCSKGSCICELKSCDKKTEY